MEDVAVLAAYFLARFRQEVAGITVKEISADALDRLVQYEYPGNVRELKNVVERAVYMAQGEVLTAADIDGALPPEAGAPRDPAMAFEDDPKLALVERVDAFAAWLGRGALERTGDKQKEAAAVPGGAYEQVRERLRQY